VPIAAIETQPNLAKFTLTDFYEMTIFGVRSIDSGREQHSGLNLNANKSNHNAR